MFLKKVIIENFRSIEHLEIDILDIAGCKLSTFFGINETGKSNILKAIALLDPTTTVQYEFDCNKKANKFSEPINIKFIFEITKEDNFKNVMSSVDANINVTDTFEPLKLEKVISFNDKSSREEYYRINPPEWINDITTDDYSSKSTAQKLFTFVVAAADVLNKQNIEKCINAEAKALIDSIVPEILFWEPSDKYLITNQINLEQFKQNPDISIPLKHIFNLAGYDNEKIAYNVERIQTNGDVRADFEEELSQCITSYINKIWYEHLVNITVRLENNNFCEIYVEDKGVQRQRFNMLQRSDGFKQFISILLSLSVENTTNQLKNKIILLDEPERSLHPSSIRCLRDELLRISQNNVVLASSHSVFMVDKKNLERHYTVTKDNGETVLEQVNSENPIQDEVIYNSLGTSIFELLEPNMLIFEGRTDKDIFDTFTNKFKEELQPSDILTISATGTKPIPHYAKFFHSKLVNGFVVVDSDKDGRNAINAILQQDPEFEDSIFELKKLVELDKENATLEDLLPEEQVLSCANELYGINFESANGASILSHIKSVKIKKEIHTDGKLEELKKKIIHQVLDDVGKEDKETLKSKYPLYLEFIKNLHSKIKEVN
jgi:AAA15 family ATPase/GTPase